MATAVTFYTEETNLDFLMPVARITFGDLTGSTYSDTVIRTALVSSVTLLASRWQSKYQVFRDDLVVSPQPVTTPSGYVYTNTVHGQAYIPDGLVEGSVFRNPFVEFTQSAPPVIQTEDEMALVLGAVLLLRKAQVSSSLAGFVSWSTEDIRYSNLGSERGLDKLLAGDILALDTYFITRIAKPRRSEFPIAYIPSLHD